MQPNPAEPLTVSVTRTVLPGCESQFEAALHEFLQLSLETPGQMGVHVLRPSPGATALRYTILRRFCDREARDAFYASALFQGWLRQVEPLSKGEPRYEELTGLETWFSLPGQDVLAAPPRAKMALATLAAVFPASLLVPLLLHPLNGAWPLMPRVFLNSAAIVLLLTYAVMPLLTRLLRSWLYGARP